MARHGYWESTSMDSFDRQLVQYVLCWAPFGNPPEDDVFPKFGMNVAQLAERFDTIVKALMGRRDELGMNDADLLARACRHPMAKCSSMVRRRGTHGRPTDPRPL